MSEIKTEAREMEARNIEAREREARNIEAREREARNIEALSEPLTIGVEAYISEEYARAERDKLWAKVWQQVGRVEELPQVGDYLTYEILDDSLIVVRTGAGGDPRVLQRLLAPGPPAVDTPPGARTPAAAAGSSSAASTAGATTWTARTPMCPSGRTGRAASEGQH